MNVTGCECNQPGFCERHGCSKDERLWQLCQQKKDYFELWESGEGPLQMPPHVDSPLLDVIDEHVVDWSVGILTTDESSDLKRCVFELAVNGFTTPVLFAQPGAVFSRSRQSLRVVEAAQQQTAWQQWLSALQSLSVMDPDAQAIVILPEQTSMIPGVASYMSHDLWPDPNAGVVLLFRPDQTDEQPEGCIEVAAGELATAVAWVFPREVAELLAADPQATPTPERNIHTFIADVLSEQGLKVFAYAPNLCLLVHRSYEEYNPTQRYNLPGGSVRTPNP